MSKTLAGPNVDTMPVSALDLRDGRCSLCDKAGPVAVAVVTGRGTTAAGDTCTDCLSVLVNDATHKGDAMVTALAGGMQRQLVTPNDDGTLPDQNGSVTYQIEGYIAELADMVENDPHAGTEQEISFLGHNKERARQIGVELEKIGGDGLLFGVHGTIAARFRGAAGRHLETAWDGVGQWRA